MRACLPTLSPHVDQAGGTLPEAGYPESPILAARPWLKFSDSICGESLFQAALTNKPL